MPPSLPFAGCFLFCICVFQISYGYAFLFPSHSVNHPKAAEEVTAGASTSTDSLCPASTERRKAKSTATTWRRNERETAWWYRERKRDASPKELHEYNVNGWGRFFPDVPKLIVHLYAEAREHRSLYTLGGVMKIREVEKKEREISCFRYPTKIHFNL